MTADAQHDGLGLRDRLALGSVICAEGYVFELERRGYLQAGPFVPEVVLDHPEQVRALHEQFVHAGSDVVEALTYYAHREKLRALGKGGLLEPLNRQALQLARDVSAETGTLLAGNVCNTNLYDPAHVATHAQVRAMFQEQVGWAAEAGVDFVIGETFRYAEEALIALDVIRGAGLTAVITLAVGRSPETREGWELPDACRRLAAEGADVVGLNCIRGPATMLPLLAGITAAVDIPVAALPVPYRTHPDQPTFQSLREPDSTLLSEGRASPPRWIRSPATGTRSLTSPETHTPSGLATWGSAVVRLRTTSGAWPKHSGGPRQRLATRRTCPSTLSLARIPCCPATIAPTPSTSRRHDRLSNHDRRYGAPTSAEQPRSADRRVEPTPL